MSFRGQILTRKHLDDKDYNSWSYKSQDADQRDKHLGKLEHFIYTLRHHLLALCLSLYQAAITV